MTTLIKCSCYSLFRGKFDRLIRITEQFTWEDLPEKDSETGETTMTGWIKKTQIMAKHVYIVCMAFHLSQSTYRIISFRAMVFNSWYPFDCMISPTYEFIALFQVCKSKLLNNFSGCFILRLLVLD